MTPATITSRAPRATNRLKNLIASEYLVLFLCIGYFTALAPFTEGLASTANLQNILLTLLPLLLLATGQTIVLISGGIDLSVTATVAITSVAGAMVMSGDGGWLPAHPMAVPLALLAMMAVGALVGLINGAAVALFRMPAFIVTLTSMMFVSGLAVWLTQSKGIGSLPGAFTVMGSQLWLAMPLTLVVAWVAHLILSRSVWGRWLYAVGHNSQTAFISGVPVAGVTVSAYVVSGVCAALASVLLTGQAETGSPVLGRTMLLDVIGATVIGGTSLFGGKGKIAWTLYGVLLLKLIDNTLNLWSLSLFAVTMVKGGVILLAAVLDAMRNRLIVREN